MQESTRKWSVNIFAIQKYYEIFAIWGQGWEGRDFQSSVQQMLSVCCASAAGGTEPVRRERSPTCIQTLDFFSESILGKFKSLGYLPIQLLQYAY